MIISFFVNVVLYALIAVTIQIRSRGKRGITSSVVALFILGFNTPPSLSKKNKKQKPHIHIISLILCYVILWYHVHHVA